MFKYLSEILSQFTAPQRILALLILVLSIVVISLGPSYINNITLNSDEFQQEIEKQKKLNQGFQNEIDSLNNKIIKNQKKCTNDIIVREIEIIRQIEDLKRSIGRVNVENNLIINDTISETESPIRVIDPRPEMMMNGLNHIQNNIRLDVNIRGGN